MNVNGKSCRLCAGSRLRLVIDLGALPVAHSLLSEPDQPEATYPLALYHCDECGLIQILDPIDPENLYRSYNYNFSSWKPEPHLENELDSIFLECAPKTVFEIGCNDGRFLAALEGRGLAVGVGVEPNSVSGYMARDKGFTVFSDMLGPAVCDAATREFGRFDLVVARQVLEHLLDLGNFFACVDSLLAEDGLLFIDVPDFEPSVLAGDCSMIWEEHVSYFTETVLSHALRTNGFAPRGFHRYDFSGGTIAVLASRNGTASPHPETAGGDRTARGIAEFESKVDDYKARLVSALGTVREAGGMVALYGTGCRACTTVNGLGLGPSIDVAVDDQAERHGKYMPGCRLRVESPHVLRGTSGPLVCLLAVNNENEDKVASGLAEIVGGRAKPVSILGPKDIWRELASLEAAAKGEATPSRAR